MLASIWPESNGGKDPLSGLDIELNRGALR